MIPPSVGMIIGYDEVHFFTGFQRPSSIFRIIEKMRIIFILGKQLISRILRRTSPTDIEINERFPILPTVKTRLSIFIFHRICSLCHRVRAHTISRLFHIDVYFIINTSLIQDNRFSRFRVIRQFCIILRIKAKTDRSKVCLLR